jgi:anti-sigma factor ChrR (cupin superfamily)
MQLNANFDQSVCVHTEELVWQASPMAGVDRRMLDRVGDEVARATSIVRYAKGSAFSQHTHSGGEEFIVLEGVFQDEHGDYPAGTYVRNPVGTHHIPRSDPGCTIFVKLWQFDPADQEQFAVDLGALKTEAVLDEPGVSRAILAARDYEHVALEEWEANTQTNLCEEGGFELLVMEGSVAADGATYGPRDWIRWPPGKTAALQAGKDGVRIWIKRGHLSEILLPPQAPPKG